MDIVAPSLILGQAIGRWGNFINQELYGQPTNLPWAVYIDPQYRLPGYEGYSTFQPLFLYESLWDFAVFGVLIYLTRRSRVKLLDGDVILLYLVLYSIGRFFIEGLKIGDVFTVLGIRTAQLIAAVLIIGCSAILVYRHRRGKSSQAAA
jgi:phosphatidylglycerol:prolipoprotein diacylglycerol transferase